MCQVRADAAMTLHQDQRLDFEKVVRTPQAVAQRARVVLLAALQYGAEYAWRAARYVATDDPHVACPLH